jgi:Tfp pilus assembly protein PilN
MPNINLISARRAERVRLTKVARGLGVLTIVTAGLGVFLVCFMFGQQIWVKQQIATQEQKLQELRPILQEIAAAEAERALLAPKLETLTQAQARTKRWFDVLEGLKHAVPEETWLTNFAVEQAGDAPSLRLNGITSNQTRVGETMMRLNALVDQYDKVDLRYTQSTERSGVPGVEFELAAQLKPLQSPVQTPAAGGTNAPKTD